MACCVLQMTPITFVTERGRKTIMEWITPDFVEVNMDTEVGRYQEDDNRPFVAAED